MNLQFVALGDCLPDIADEPPRVESAARRSTSCTTTSRDWPSRTTSKAAPQPARKLGCAAWTLASMS